MGQARFRGLIAVALLPVALAGDAAWAHWCHDLWGSSYNIVVKPAVDTVNVPSGGQGTLDVFVQNNMGYPLKNFSLRAATSGYTVGITRQAPKVTGYLMPGESLRHTLTLSGGSGGSVAATAVNFYVDFGDGTQDQEYGGGTTGARHAVMRTQAGTLRPARPVTIPAAWDQALHLGASAKADFTDLAGGLDDLMGEFCAGRGSWDTGGGPAISSYCSGSNTTCPATVTRGHTKFDYQHLWASFELAYRKSALGARVGPLRARLICAINDNSPSFRWFPYAMLGYLGEDATVRTFLEGKISSGTADERAAAKSALLMFGNAADRTAHRADVVTAVGSTNAYIRMLAATSLGIVDADDAAVNSTLIPQSGWVEPDTGDNGLNFYAAHLLNLVAWNRRGWAVDAAYTGSVTFYGSDTVAPRAPANIACSALSNGTVRVTWAAVTQDVAGGAETIQTYRVYGGTAARPTNATRPGEQGFDYDHVDPTTGLFFNFTGLSGTAVHRFTVTAVDAAGNASVYGQEVSCTPRYAPTAAVTCTPSSGLAPLSTTCDSAGSTDPNGTSDIVTRAWRLDGAAQPNGSTFSTTFSTPGAHTIQLTVTDAAGLTSTASATVTANSATNQAPVARAAATPSSGAPPLTVQFSSAGSSDPDSGQTLSYSWDFADGTAASTQANPSHVFNTAGTYDVLLTVTDDGTPQASSTASVRVTVTGNSPPDLTTASATPAAGNAPLTVTFDATGVTDPDGDAMTFRWTFGDGSAQATGASVTHVYTAAGSYAAQLSVTDDGVPALPAPVTADFTVVVRPPGTANRAPDCAAATVTPSRGAAPLKVVLDATGCVDPDGDPLTLTWRVPRSMTTEDVFDQARVEVTLLDPGTHTLSLHARDGNAQAMEIDRTFDVVVTPDLEPVVGECGCGAGAGPLGLAALALAALLRARRSRSA